MNRRPTTEELETRIADLERRLAACAADARPAPHDSTACVTAFLSSPDNLLISRLKDGMVLDVSDTFLHTSGFLREEVVGRTILDIGIWADR